VGDLFYEQALAARVLAWLEEAEARGIVALIGDPGRSYLPRERLAKLGEYRVAVTRDLEDAEIKLTSVWRLSRYC
jgi:predicted nicotinamide N-methyase